METIFALGTGAGRAAIAVIRLSGPATREIVVAMAGALPGPRRARFATFRDPESGEALDQGLVLFFPAPGSATGEDYAEFHIHGGRAVVDAMLKALGGRARPAEPGEFARRGFAHGKLDLSQAEALADLVEAQTEAQRRQALRIAGGALRRSVEAWRATLIEALALIEAELDFSDEADVSAFDHARLAALLDPALAGMRAALAQAPASERMR
jgi:tRNA modification GTPase